ncbi:hypothetical protein MTZ49_03580 [Entomomonas sp. E2T0]|uniref:hypothetical protein n=1 Tax=Entomomonas sp. E2T0 TaxID=2930213 RepID=UPI0022281E24|nr:hypothetical protein [Entomomonas sp. E2T0]UYZ84656.1 hypothetical protein MTZ49_03580 [Entomomonas sp. E2T0]
MRKYATSLFALSLLIYPLSIQAKASETNCQKTPLIQGVDESSLQSWQKWQQFNSLEANLKGDGKTQELLVMGNKATNEWVVVIEDAGQKTLVYAEKSTQPLQIATTTIDEVSTLQVINPETKQAYDISYNRPDDFSICPTKKQTKRSNYLCTGIGEIHELPKMTADYDPNSHQVDFDEDGVKETFNNKIIPGNHGIRHLYTVKDGSGYSTVVYNKTFSWENTATTFTNAYALNGGKPVIHIILAKQGRTVDAVEINYLGKGQFTTCPLSNGIQILQAYNIPTQ